MAGMFTVTPSALRDKAADLRNQNKTLRSQVDQLRTQEGSLRGMWEGEAHDTFAREFTKDMTKLDEFASAIDMFANKLDEIAAEYERAENANVQTAATRLV